MCFSKLSFKDAHAFGLRAARWKLNNCKSKWIEEMGNLPPSAVKAASFTVVAGALYVSLPNHWLLQKYQKDIQDWPCHVAIRISSSYTAYTLSSSILWQSIQVLFSDDWQICTLDTMHGKVTCTSICGVAMRNTVHMHNPLWMTLAHFSSGEFVRYKPNSLLNNTATGAKGQWSSKTLRKPKNWDCERF